MESKFKKKNTNRRVGNETHRNHKKNEKIHRKPISNSLPFQQATTTPAKKLNTRQSAADQPTCSKTLDFINNGGASCIYSSKEAPKAIANYERSEDWLKTKGQPRNKRGQFTSPNKNAIYAELNLSIISDDDDFECYNMSEAKPVQTNIVEELQLLPKETNLTPEQGRYNG